MIFRESSLYINAYMLTSLTMHFCSQLDRLCLVTECMAEKMVLCHLEAKCIHLKV